jgi:hypothetical protein
VQSFPSPRSRPVAHVSTCAVFALARHAAPRPVRHDPRSSACIRGRFVSVQVRHIWWEPNRIEVPRAVESPHLVAVEWFAVCGSARFGSGTESKPGNRITRNKDVSVRPVAQVSTCAVFAFPTIRPVDNTLTLPVPTPSVQIRPRISLVRLKNAARPQRPRTFCHPERSEGSALR